MITIDRKRAVVAALPLFLYGLLIALITLFLVVVGGTLSDVLGKFVWGKLSLLRKKQDLT
jgi:hypothetical protein